MEETQKKYRYKEIEEYIMEGIRSERFKPNSLLPTEMQLCQQFDVSRMTVNKALNHLEKKGFIERIRGSGSYVKLPYFEQDVVTMTSFSEQLRRKGTIPSTKLLSYSVINAKDVPLKNLSKALCVGTDEMIHYFVRLRYGNGKPIAIQYTYVPVSRISSIDISCLNKSFYEYIEKKLKLEMGNGKSHLCIQYPDDFMMNHLNIDKEHPVVYVNHISSLKNGLPFEYVDTFTLWEYFNLDFYNKRVYQKAQ